MAKIDTTTLAKLAGVPEGTIASWISRDFIGAPATLPGEQRQWGALEALVVVTFAQLLRRNRSVPQASAETAGMMQALGQVGGRLLAGADPRSVPRLLFISADLADGRRTDHFTEHAEDAERALRALLKAGAVRLELTDRTGRPGDR